MKARHIDPVEFESNLAAYADSRDSTVLGPYLNSVLSEYQKARIWEVMAANPLPRKPIKRGRRKGSLAFKRYSSLVPFVERAWRLIDENPSRTHAAAARLVIKRLSADDAARLTVKFGCLQRKLADALNGTIPAIKKLLPHRYETTQN